jgi:hypothetical protein
MEHTDWPPLPLAAWEPTYLTLHRWTQIVGKVRLEYAPFVNHWWHVPLYVTSQGLTTSDIPCGARHLTITFDLCTHRLVAHTNDKGAQSFVLEPMSVALFYDRLLRLLERLEVSVDIWPVPVEVVDRTPFTLDQVHAAYDRKAVERLHRILLSTERVFSVFRSRFVGKNSPVHFFWGAFDLAVTRFSGRLNPTPPRDLVNGEAYSHEVISHGFWPGGDWPGASRVEEPIFYAYAVPEPEGLRTAKIQPSAAKYDSTLKELVLPYEAVRTAANPEATLLAFMESTYVAAAQLAGWDIAGFQHPRVAALRSPIQRDLSAR